MLPFDSQHNHHLCLVVKSFIDPVELLLDFFEFPFVVDGSFPFRIVVNHQIEVKILVLIPILVQRKVWKRNGKTLKNKHKDHNRI